MIKAFIVRPFGTKQNVDFEKVDLELIQPALKQAGIIGSTTAAIIEQGNIREDMFAQLLLADIVIADLSIHNANVFYELGIRHSLRDKRTFLIRCSIDEIPFDLKTDRYLSYPAEDPASALNKLVEGLKATLLNEKQDSPVFYMLPNLVSQDPENFLVVPPDFGEEVSLAQSTKQPGKLALLSEEVSGFPWEIQALRKIGEAQYLLKDFEAAQLTWETIRDYNAKDIEANDRLATIYQRLAQEQGLRNKEKGWESLAKSDLAIKRMLESYSKMDKQKRAEIHALRARNAKSRWVDTWKDLKVFRHKALQSKYLVEAYKEYLVGFHEDLNHFYSGINAIALLTILTQLASAMPNEWEIEFDTKEEADYTLKKYIHELNTLITVVGAAITSARKRLQKEEKDDPWLGITEADLACFTSDRPARVANLYEDAIEGINDFNSEAAVKQLEIFEKLEVNKENVAAALEVLNKSLRIDMSNQTHYILFTGHMIDKVGRKEPRFPADKEDMARAAIKAAVENEKQKINRRIIGISGGACGGDILFHEVCQELGIETELYLALPREQFLIESVQFAGAKWVERFNELYKKQDWIILSDSKKLPNWLQKKSAYSIWERNNLWMLNSALVCGGLNMSMITLWDGKTGDGPGGTDHMVKKAKERGAKTIVIDTKELFKL